MKWIVNQAGHRERYAIARALHEQGQLQALWTDLWVPPHADWIRLAPRRIAGRLRDHFSGDLPASHVRSCTRVLLSHELFTRVRHRRGSDRVLAKNVWWEDVTLRRFRRNIDPADVFFCYCYGADRAVARAKANGMRVVLGQIDPGPVEDHKVEGLTRRHSSYRDSFRPGSAEYYEKWRRECQLADRILVNSTWSADALTQAGIPREKMAVIPLVHTPPQAAQGWTRTFPQQFDSARRLRVLFLGQCILRKGIAEAIEAANALADVPIEFRFVGNTNIENLTEHFCRARISYFPRVSRTECEAHYQWADVFLFPTHSDGFGLTQLEAQGWGLPMITTRFCGEVVRHGETGWVLEEVTVDAIVATLREIVANPQTLRRNSSSIRPWHFTITDLGHRLVELAMRITQTC